MQREKIGTHVLLVRKGTTSVFWIQWLESLDGPVGGQLSEGEELGEVDDAESFIYRLLNKVQRTRFMYIK